VARSSQNGNTNVSCFTTATEFYTTTLTLGHSLPWKWQRRTATEHRALYAINKWKGGGFNLKQQHEIWTKQTV